MGFNFRKKRIVVSVVMLALTLLGITTFQNCSGQLSDPPIINTAASATASLQLIPSSYTVTPGQTVTLTASGGSGTYNMPTASSGTIAVAGSNQYVYTVPAGTSAVTIGITDSNGNSATASLTVSGSGGLTVTPSTMSVIPNSAVSISASGGSGSYTWTVSLGSGTLSSSSGESVVFTAPPTIGQTSVVTVIDTSGLSGTSMIITSSAASTAAAGSCDGTFTFTQGNNSATLKLVEDASGNVAGSLTWSGSNSGDFVSGTCLGTSVNFTDTTSNTTYTGSFYSGSTGVALIGTYTATSSTIFSTSTSNGTWMAVP